jgi:glycosyltransferase involved in cell wall biosynthesis
VDNASDLEVSAEEVDVLRAPQRLTVGAARNFGLDQVRTEWVVLWDADDVMLPGTLQRMLGAADDQTVAVWTGILDAQTWTRHHWPRRFTDALGARSRLFATVNAISSLYPTTGTLMRADAVRAATGFADANAGDDWVLGVSLAFRGRVRSSGHRGRLYRRHSTSISAKWRTFDEVLDGQALVRARLRADPAIPAPVRLAVPLVAVLQTFVLLVLRPVARALSPWRREHRRGRHATSASQTPALSERR